MSEFDRITFKPEIMGGRACIRDLRVPVSLVLNLVADGMTTEKIVDAYPYLEPRDIHQALGTRRGWPKKGFIRLNQRTTLQGVRYCCKSQTTNAKSS